MAAPAPDLAAENRLARETSPYLLQHKHNPVAWWPWGAEALAEAKRANKPILLSVGYAACHWCHVMAHESFEDAATAAVMNELFVNIKVDREERPDIDQIYMAALHHLGEHGGWPLTMFLTPAGEPVWGGTYFPDTSRYGKPAFVDVLREVARLFREQPAKIAQNRDALMERLAARARPAGKVVIGARELDQLAAQIGGAMDPLHGGLRGAPKFPQAALFELLWRAGLREEAASTARHPEVLPPPYPPPQAGEGREGGASKDGGPASASFEARPLRGLAPQEDGVGDTHAQPANRYFTIVDTTLERICEGGIYDHLGGGFARYSVDERWLVPHFEKMLYDNAQLLELLTLAWQRTGKPLYRQRARETVGWLEREMTTPEGGFASSLDADSEGEEGKFYVWSAAAIERALGRDDAAFFAAHYDVTSGGNFEGHTILNRLKGLPRTTPFSEADEARLATLRAKLLAARAERIRPGLDDKVLADWNGLMIAALARGAPVFGDLLWLDMAELAFHFVREQMTRGDRLGHSFRDGRLLLPGLASDFAAMIRAALALAETTGDAHYLDQALVWQRALDRHYRNPDNGGYFLTADDAEGLVVRPSALTDDATPNPTAVAADNLVRLAALAGDAQWRAAADALFDGVLPHAAPSLFAHAALLNALDTRLRLAEIVVTGTGARAEALTAAALKLPFLDRAVLRAPSAEALPASHPARDKLAAAPDGAAFVCVGETCSLPVTGAADIAAAIKQLRT